MGMKPYKKAIAKVGSYTDQQTGKEKNQYARYGTLMQKEDGELSFRLDPMVAKILGVDWINFWELDPPRSKQESHQKGAADDSFEDDEDIPF